MDDKIIFQAAFITDPNLSGSRGDVDRRREMKRIFTEIHDSNAWRSAESVSGVGATRKQTQVLVQELPEFLRELKITSMLDIPCGDFQWMRKVQLDEIRYTGADIVAELIRQNREKYEDAQRSFVPLDLVHDQLPTAELVLCRDCLVHLSDNDVLRALRNICASGANYLLTTTFSRRTRNVDITTGGWRTLNLTKPPFGLPKPKRLINENCTEFGDACSDKSLGLWRIEDIRPLVFKGGV